MEELTKEEAVNFILKTLRSPMSMAVKPTRDQAFELAEKYNISALELLTTFKEMVWRV